MAPLEKVFLASNESRIRVEDGTNVFICGPDP
jgi:hypothetical protein